MKIVRNPASGFVFKFLFFFFVFYLTHIAATVNNKIESDDNPNLDQFRYCLKQTKHPRLSECIGRTAISFLQRFDERENYTLVDDFVSTKDDKIAARSLVNILDTDPVDFRGILENAGAVFSQRNFEWHMDSLYPGLMLKIGPTADANSVAEFIIDPAVAERQFNYQEPSTARILAKQYLVPFLLGLKFNLVALVPLLFAGICLLLKKSLFLAKLAIYVSSFLGIGGVAGILGGLGGVGGLGGAFSGPGALFGFGGGPHHIRGHAQSHVADIASANGYTGYFPGKTTVVNQHYETNSDDVYHGPPYKRSERKVNFDKPRELFASPTTATTTTLAPAASAMVDHFYDYERQTLMQDRSIKPRSKFGKLGPSAYEDDEEEVKKIFKPSQSLGWKVVDMRI